MCTRMALIRRFIKTTENFSLISSTIWQQILLSATVKFEKMKNKGRWIDDANE